MESNISIQLTDPNIAVRFREMANVVAASHGGMTLAARTALVSKAQEMGVHPVDLDAMLDEIAAILPIVSEVPAGHINLPETLSPVPVAQHKQSNVDQSAEESQQRLVHVPAPWLAHEPQPLTRVELGNIGVNDSMALSGNLEVLALASYSDVTILYRSAGLWKRIGREQVASSFGKKSVRFAQHPCIAVSDDRCVAVSVEESKLFGKDRFAIGVLHANGSDAPILKSFHILERNEHATSFCFSKIRACLYVGTSRGRVLTLTGVNFDGFGYMTQIGDCIQTISIDLHHKSLLVVAKDQSNTTLALIPLSGGLSSSYKVRTVRGTIKNAGWIGSARKGDQLVFIDYGDRFALFDPEHLAQIHDMHLPYQVSLGFGHFSRTSPVWDLLPCVTGSLLDSRVLLYRPEHPDQSLILNVINAEAVLFSNIRQDEGLFAILRDKSGEARLTGDDFSLEVYSLSRDCQPFDASGDMSQIQIGELRPPAL